MTGPHTAPPRLRFATPSRASTPAARVSLSEVLSALSRALDLTEGQPAGHTIRACLIGMRMAEELGLDTARRTALYYALLLKDAGCSSNAARMSSLFGTDDRAAKPRMKSVDWHRPLQLALRTARTAGRGGTFATRVRHFLRVARTPDVTRELIQIRCDRGAQIARRLGFPDETADAIHSLDEHWCGRGYPDGLRGEDIPLLARIANLAQTLELFLTADGVEAALAVARRRRGRWFDPRLVALVLRWRGDRRWWTELQRPGLDSRVAAAEPSSAPRWLDSDGLDDVARAFAEIIDAKSPYTSRHSTNVAGYAVGIARTLGFTPAAVLRIRRAGLLHDIGKLGVSNAILDKPAALTPEERAAVERHPVYTWDILSRVTPFRDFAWVAAAHHEKLDGSGYPWGLRAPDLEPAARILAVADIYEALTADRPYRAGLAPATALEIIGRDRGPRLCASAVDALAAYVASGGTAEGDAG